jgi:hypothetical protein
MVKESATTSWVRTLSSIVTKSLIWCCWSTAIQMVRASGADSHHSCRVGGLAFIFVRQLSFTIFNSADEHAVVWIARSAKWKDTPRLHLELRLIQSSESTVVLRLSMLRTSCTCKRSCTGLNMS